MQIHIYYKKCINNYRLQLQLNATFIKQILFRLSSHVKEKIQFSVFSDVEAIELFISG